MNAMVQQSAMILRDEFIHNDDAKEALVASIESAMKDAPEEVFAHDMAILIANRIIGLEDK